MASSRSNPCLGHESDSKQKAKKRKISNDDNKDLKLVLEGKSEGKSLAQHRESCENLIHGIHHNIDEMKKTENYEELQKLYYDSCNKKSEAEDELKCYLQSVENSESLNYCKVPTIELKDLSANIKKLDSIKNDLMNDTLSLDDMLDKYFVAESIRSGCLKLIDKNKMEVSELTNESKS